MAASRFTLAIWCAGAVGDSEQHMMSLDVNTADLTDDLMARIEAKEGIAVARQRLVRVRGDRSMGQVEVTLHSGLTLGWYNLHSHPSVRLVAADFP